MGLYLATPSSRRIAGVIALMTSYFLAGCSGGEAASEGQAAASDAPIPLNNLTTPATSQSQAMSPAHSSQPYSSSAASSRTHNVPSSIAHSSVSSTTRSFSSRSSAFISGTSNGIPELSAWPSQWQFYAQKIAQPLVNSHCIACHRSDGMAARTPLNFVRDNDYANAQILENYLLAQNDGEKLLNKISGFNDHGGGAVVNRQQQSYFDMRAFVNLVIKNPVQNEAAFSITRLEPRSKTLRRAALILAGRLPTRDENDRAIRSDDELVKVLKELMLTKGFNDFLMRGANDQLLTDSFLNGQFFELSNGFAPYYPVGSNERFNAYQSGDIWPFEKWNHNIYYGMVKAPLSLIAHTVMTDQPYTNIVTADYTMGNQSMADYMRQQALFVNGNKFETKPMKNNGQILIQPGHEQYLDPSIGLRIDQHGQWVDYPHAGILNEPAFLARYPSSDTNRNRLRAKMVYKLFLGVEIENIAARVIAPDALIDTQNPTLNNPSCAVCHQTMDPVAGAFQNFGVDGWYRSSWEGLDGLPDSYKFAPDTPYQHGDLWYRDMRSPGFEGQFIANNERSLAELGQYIANDERFAVAAVKFWWPAIMSDDLLPTSFAAAQPKLYKQQQDFVAVLAKQFKEGFEGRQPYRLKDLLSAMVMSDWFRADGIELSKSLNEAESQVSVAGVRLLTPEELENKVKSLLGYAWGEREDFWANNGFWSYLDEQFRIYYGGIDSIGVTARAKTFNSLMANVAETQAVNLACAAVLLDANRNQASQRLLRNQMRYVSPFSYDWQLIELAKPQSITLSLQLIAGQNRIRMSHLNAERIGPVVFDAFKIVATDGVVLFDASAAESQARFSQEYLKPMGIQAGGMIVLEKGYVDITFDARNYTDIQLKADVLTPIEWLEPAQVSVDVTGAGGQGQTIIRQQLVEIFNLTQGVEYAVDSQEVTAALDAFMSVWQTLEMHAAPMTLAQHANNYCDLSAEGLPKIRTLNTSDPQRLLSAWSHLMVYFFTDFYFLHE